MIELTAEDIAYMKEEIDSEVFRTYNGWLKKGRHVLKGEVAALTSEVDGFTVHLFSKDQTGRIKTVGKKKGSVCWEDYYDDDGYNGDIDSSYGW